MGKVEKIETQVQFSIPFLDCSSLMLATLDPLTAASVSGSSQVCVVLVVRTHFSKPSV